MAEPSVALPVDGLQVREVESPVERAHGAATVTAGPWEMQIIAVEMKHLETGRLLEHALQEDEVVRQLIHAACIQPQGPGATGDELRSGPRVARGEQRDLMPLPHQLLRQEGNHALGAP